MSPLINDVLLWTNIPLSVVAGAALHYRARVRTADRKAADSDRKAENASAELDQAVKRIAAREEEARHFAESRLPALVYALQHGTPPGYGALLHLELRGTLTAAAYESVLKQVAGLLEDASKQAEETARSTVRATVKSVQALLYEQQIAITRLLDSEDDQRLLALLQPVDHTGNQLLRRLLVLGVIAGTWPGRQSSNVPVVDAVRGAMSRIRDYQRVRPPRPSHLYLAGRYVEPVVLALAELLDNAARHSPPSTPVEVHLITGAQGVSIEIHDAGAGMSIEAEMQARRRLSGDEFRLTDLRNPPSFGHLGVGALARQYGFRVHLDDRSVHGGTRAVMFLPQALLAEAPPPDETAPAPQVAPAVPAAPSRPADPAAADAASPYEITHDGLAKRRPQQSA
ncbi:ATP-binding protein, partial [Streptomyces sp. RP5T]|uniref:ATP-binding protein n=1 Tax=Streptomyces sp. RP5T TaxID=2490848 RepID=UPI000FBA5971